MSDRRISTERRGHLFLIGLDRAQKRNAFDPPMWEQLCTAYGDYERDPDARCAVVFAHGDHFTGGLDLAAMTPYFVEGRFPLPEGGLEPLGLFGPPRSKPVLCAVQGICFTIGIELMLACDVRVAHPGTRFGQIEIKRGIYPVGGGTIRFVQEIGWGNAMRWLLTADEIPAAEAHRVGLVQELSDDPLARAVALAEVIASQAPLGVRATIASSRLALLDGQRAAAARLFPDLAPILGSDDAREGLASFVERRAARFSGR